MTRCYNKKSTGYHHYGARGIEVCEEWKDFETFYSWYKERDMSLSLDRKNNNRGYSPSNCRMVTMKEQAQNTRRIRTTNSTGYRGVSIKTRQSKKTGEYVRYETTVHSDKKLKHLGTFKTPREAALVRDKYILDNNLNHTLNDLEELS